MKAKNQSDAATPRRRNTVREKRGSATSPRRGAAASSRRRVALSVLLFAFCLLLFTFRPAAAHEPITTKVRFNKEIVRILGRSCLACHHSGGLAMSLATYDEARPWAKAIKEEVLNKRMPPWHAVKGFGDFRNAPVLTQREIDLLVNWVEGGAPKGEDADFPAGPLYNDDWALGKPDLILKSQTETVIAADTDETRTMTMATNLTEARWLAAIDLRPGNDSIVHCAKFYLAGGRTAAKSGNLPNPQPPTPDACLGTWMPGQKTLAWPDGAAQPVPAGARIVVKLHYRGAAEAMRDQSEVGLYFAKTPPRKLLQEVAITDTDAVIPAGAAAHPVKVAFTTQEDVEAVALRPAVSPLITSLQATVYRPDGSEEVLLWARGYQFDWQPIYYLKRAAALPKGTRIEVIAYLDNSDDNRNNPNDPPKPLRLGDLTGEPLCALTIAKARSPNE